jgi:hypothetical protein
MKARNAKTFDEVCTLVEDNADFDNHSIITDGNEVTLSNRLGQSIDIPRTTFNKLIDWYQNDQPEPPTT